MSQVLKKTQRPSGKKVEAEGLEQVSVDVTGIVAEITKNLKAITTKKEKKKRRCYCGKEVGHGGGKCDYLLSLTENQLRMVRKAHNCTC